MARAVLSYSVPPARQARPAGFGGEITVGSMRLSGWSALWQLGCLLLTGLAGVLIGGVITANMGDLDPRWKEVLATFTAGGLCTVVALLLVWAGGQRLSSIGWHARRLGEQIGIGLVGAVVIFALVFVGSAMAVQFYPELLEESSRTRDTIRDRLPPMSWSVTLAMLVFVAIWEEVIFRGFLLTRLQAIVGSLLGVKYRSSHRMLFSWLITIAVGAGLFAMLHGYQGPMAVTFIGLLGAFMGLLFVWTRSLVSVVVLHLLFNLGMIAIVRAT